MQDTQTMMGHLQGHVTYPADKATLVAACNGMSDVSEEDKKEFIEKLPEGNYTSAEEVKTALGM